jgi:hypothetical protein
MFRVLVLRLLALGALSALAAADEKFTSANGKYTATFPSAPKEFSTPDGDVNPGMGKYKYFSASLEINKDSAFMVMHHDYPQGVLKDEAQIVLERVKEGSKGEKGRVVEDREIALGTDKVPGRAFIINQGSYFYRARIFLKDSRLYQVIVVGKSKDDVATPAADKFMDSFEITK